MCMIMGRRPRRFTMDKMYGYARICRVERLIWRSFWRDRPTSGLAHIAFMRQKSYSFGA
jgi:hypothetical protein